MIFITTLNSQVPGGKERKATFALVIQQLAIVIIFSVLFFPSYQTAAKAIWVEGLSEDGYTYYYNTETGGECYL